MFLFFEITSQGLGIWRFEISKIGTYKIFLEFLTDFFISIAINTMIVKFTDTFLAIYNLLENHSANNETQIVKRRKKRNYIYLVLLDVYHLFCLESYKIFYCHLLFISEFDLFPTAMMHHTCFVIYVTCAIRHF